VEQPNRLFVYLFTEIKTTHPIKTGRQNQTDNINAAIPLRAGQDLANDTEQKSQKANYKY
jgi:hypothetical protein